MGLFPSHTTEHLSPGARLCLACCRQSGTPDDRALAWLNKVGAFEELMAVGVRHGVAGLILSSLHGDTSWALADTVRARGASALGLVRRQAGFWELEQERLLAALVRDGLDPVVLKGGGLRHSAYRYAVERTMGDLDLLVPPDRVDETLEALERLGYRSPYPEGASSGFREHHYHERVAHPNGFEVEVHWGLSRPGTPVGLDPRAFLERAVRITPEHGPALRVPSPEDNILHAVSQSELGSFRKLSRLVDIDRIVTSCDPDWHYVESAAERGGLGGHLALCLRLASRVVGTTVPERLASGEGLGPIARRALGAMDPLRHLMEEPGRGSFTKNLLVRMWARVEPSARRRLLDEVGAVVDDPLDWVWQIHIAQKEGVAPEDVARKPVGKGVVLAKLAVIQTLLVPRLAFGGRSFWRAPEVALRGHTS